MKKTLLIALFLIPFLGLAQTPKLIDGFLGIKFGSTRAAAIVAMKAKGAILDKQNSTTEELEYNHVKLGHRESVDFGIFFLNDKAYKAVFVFKIEEEPKTIEYYYSLVNDINEVYGIGTPTKIFRSPYKDGDGDEILAIEGGYADLYTDWNSGGGSIQASIDNKLNIILIYQDDALAKAAASKQKTKEKSDF